MTETDKLNIDSIIARLLEGKSKYVCFIYHVKSVELIETLRNFD